MSKTSYIFYCFFLIQFLSCRMPAQPTTTLGFEVRVADDLQADFPEDGRVFIFLNNSNRRSLITSWPSPGLQVFARNVEDWTGAEPLLLDDTQVWTQKADFILSGVPEGIWYVQVVWDHDREESRIGATGNMYSPVTRIEVGDTDVFEIELSEQFGPLEVVDHKFVREVDQVSESLSQFWDKEVHVKASVLLPASWYDEPDRKYPVRYNIAGYGGRYTRVNRLVNSEEFFDWWMSDDAPQMIQVFLDGEGPFGDSYQMDSDNSGPYGTNLVEELIPLIERDFRGLGTPESRFVDGCSTGGWVSLALQLYYPDFFNGVWSYSPDAIEFENYQLVNIYKDENEYVNEWGNLRPLARDIYGDPRMTVKDFLQFENVLGWSDTYVTSGSQFSAHTALYSPKGADGLPAPMFDPHTGVIDREVAEHWKKYDMKILLQENWPELGPKLQGKIYIWMGDMDNFYLNPATRAFDDFIQRTTNPKSDATIVFEPMQGHCAGFDHREILEMMWAKWEGKE
ncbi:alpha/beta hydrolase-fold protein [Flavilitoribacter nigricans]|nr:alpha/beta hydrolase-fold protein [Flavilitoribacter nigricans]